MHRKSIIISLLFIAFILPAVGQTAEPSQDACIERPPFEIWNTRFDQIDVSWKGERTFLDADMRSTYDSTTRTLYIWKAYNHPDTREAWIAVYYTKQNDGSMSTAYVFVAKRSKLNPRRKSAKWKCVAALTGQEALDEYLESNYELVFTN